jgi:5-methylcytosine-specific restriction endonuclease McrA
MLQRISTAAQKAAKIAAAIEDTTMEEWCSQTLLDAAQRIRYSGAPTTPKKQSRRIASPDPVDRGVVFLRDKGLCGECHEPVDPKNWHLDHITPTSRGGEHSYENTRVTHPRCNLSKGPRPTLEEAS